MEDQQGLRMGALKTGALVGVASSSGRLGTLAVGHLGCPVVGASCSGRFVTYALGHLVEVWE